MWLIIHVLNPMAVYLNHTGDPGSVMCRTSDVWRWMSIHNRSHCCPGGDCWFHIKCSLNSLAPGRYGRNCVGMFLKHISMIHIWVISCGTALKWMPHDLADDKSILAQEMAWCRQATSHYLSQCWARSMSPHGITRPQYWSDANRLNAIGSYFLSEQHLLLL